MRQADRDLAEAVRAILADRPKPRGSFRLGAWIGLLFGFSF